jgi:Uma2 family endonuclease
MLLDERSQPEPDVMLCVLPHERYAREHPTPRDALLVVEVSRSTLAFDLNRKKRAYARNGTPEYWVVDLVNDRVHVFREPRDGDYAVHFAAGRGEDVAPAAFPSDAFAVDDFLPPQGPH